MLVLAFLSVWALAGLTHAADTVLHIGNGGEPQTLDPHRYNLRLEETLLNDLFLGLTTFNAHGELVPGAAESWHTSEDGLTWTFNLRSDLRWSDGVAITAADFVYAYRRLQDPKTAASLAYFMYMLKNAPEVNKGVLPPASLGVRAPEPLTLILELSQPYPYLLERLLYPTAFPVPKHTIEQYGDDWVKPANWVSNGAYFLKEWQPQAHVTMQKNPYFHTEVAVNEVRYHPVVNEQSAYNRYRTAELDAIGSFPVGELVDARTDYADELQVSDLLSMMYLVFNTEQAPFDDVRVRQALSLAVDQQILTDKVLRSGNKPAYSFVPQFVQGYPPVELAHKNTNMAARRQTARELLAEAGFTTDNPLQLVLRHVNSVEGKKVNLAITGMWKQIGVDAVLQQAELRNHFADLRQGDFQVAWAGWVGENNPEHYLTLLQSDIGNVNYGRFKLAAYDEILHSAQSMADLSDRNKLLNDAERLVVNHYPVIPLYTVAVRRLVSQNISGWHENLRDVHQVRYLVRGQ
jgi:oligopeptide transport system substrate-binding protein